MAFDKVLHPALFYSLERMGVSPKLSRLIMLLYEAPTFRVALNGQISELHIQTAGIRQGCPLS
eukprot:1586532-Prorocentrum_lima.AAC.1